MKKHYTDFNLWKSDVKELGWIHAHDNFVVCDGEHDELIGEFDSETNTGWAIIE